MDTSWETMSMGTGNTMVLLFSAEMLFRVWRYLQNIIITSLVEKIYDY